MKFSLCYVYFTLLLVSLISSCILFILVAAKSHQSMKRKDEMQNEIIINDEINEHEYLTLDPSVEEKPLITNHKKIDKPLESENKDLNNLYSTKINTYGHHAGDIQETSNLNDLFFLSSVNKNSGAILSDISTTPSFVSLNEKTTDLEIENKMDDNLEILLNNYTSDNGILSFNLSSMNENVKIEQKDERNVVHSEKKIKLLSIVDKILTKDAEVYINSSNDSQNKEMKPTNSGSLELGIDQNIDAEPSDNANLTVEEKPIPVFSEWAQKQMEEAEKQLEKDIVNTSAMKKHPKTSGYKTQVLKLGAKNYASPDCGAKILSSNPEAQSTGSILSSHRDEYLLNPCTSKIWFVVELCEPIQAENIELANFELFSSSPKDFSVSVSNRFPTRDWSNVGQFTANDERDIQSFKLDPQLFGKFLRIDVISHYNSEHYCPISLFRVYGTSEFEAFETDNQLSATSGAENDYDEEIDEIGSNREDNKKNGNILKSASEAVMNIVKKAAEALAKTNENIVYNKNNDEYANDNIEYNNEDRNVKLNQCVTPFYSIKCDKCSEESFGKIHRLISCKQSLLKSLVNLEIIKDNLIKSHYCANVLGFNLISENEIIYNFSQSYIIYLFNEEYLGALCNYLAYYNHTTSLTMSVKDLSTKNKYNNDDTNNEFNPVNITIEQSNMNIAMNFNNKESQKLKQTEEFKYDNGNENIIVKKFEDVNFQPQEILDIDNNLKNIQSNEIELDESKYNIPELFVDDRKHNYGNIKIKSTEESNHLEKNDNEASNVRDVLNNEQMNAEQINNIGPDVPTEVKSESWETLDSIILNEQTIDHSTKNSQTHYNQPSVQKVQPESVFLRLSNRIKALERNMSLSGQYLEELSKRYKKQVEELKQTFSKTLTSIEEQNKRNIDREQLLMEENMKLREKLDELIELIFNWRSIVIFIGGFILIQLLILFSLLKICSKKKDKTKESKYNSIYDNTNLRSMFKPKLSRRKSIECVIGYKKISPAIRRRRPSEEALNIGGTYEELLISENDIENYTAYDNSYEKKNKNKLRKTSNPVLKYNKYVDSVDPIERIVIGSDEAYNESRLNYRFKTKDKKSLHISLDEQQLREDNAEISLSNSYTINIPNESDSQNLNSVSEKTTTFKTSKTRRLSSPAFFKSALSRNGSAKKSEKIPSKRNGETAAWEWYRIKKSSSQKKILNNITNSHINGNGKNSDTNSDLSSMTGSLNNSERKSGGSFKRIFKKVF